MTRVFVSYSWDSEQHKEWVRELAARLRSDGVDVILDQWHLLPGDQIPEFMERSVRESNYVLIICTHRYRERVDNRSGGVGYEGDIISAEVLTKSNPRKFIPILREHPWKESAPTWLAGKLYIDLSCDSYLETHYQKLLSVLRNELLPAPPIGYSYDHSKSFPIIAPPAQPLVMAKDHPPQLLTILLRPTGDTLRDIERVKRLHRIFIAYPGEDRFTFHIFEDGRGHLIEYPNDTTNACAELFDELKDAEGPESIRVEPITYV